MNDTQRRCGGTPGHQADRVLLTITLAEDDPYNEFGSPEELPLTISDATSDIGDILARYVPEIDPAGIIPTVWAELIDTWADQAKQEQSLDLDCVFLACAAPALERLGAPAGFFERIVF